MKKTGLFTLILWCLGLVSSPAQTGVALSGQIDTALMRQLGCKTLLVKLEDISQKLNGTERVFSLPISPDGRFQAGIPLRGKFAYLSFRVEVSQHKVSAGSRIPLGLRYPYLEEAYLFESGDSVNMEVKKGAAYVKGNRFLFSGKGSEKLSLQFALHTTMDMESPVFQPGISRLLDAGRYEQGLQVMEMALQSSISLRYAILEGYRYLLDRETFQRICRDAVANASYPMVRKLFMTGFGLQGVLAAKKDEAVQRFYRRYLDRDSIGLQVLKSDTGSPYYLECLFEREWNSVKLFSADKEKGPSFAAIYRLIRRKYTGLLRDRLTLIAVRKLQPYFLSEIRQSGGEVLAGLDTAPARQAMESWLEKQSTAYPFALADEHGEIHRLQDFSGKVLVIDFWFTGCSWCTNVNRAMHSIIEKYRGNDAIVFITIGLDRDSQLWKRGLLTGKYTSPGNLNLHIGSAGFEDPMMRHYNYLSAPQQLIIDRQGHVLSTAPPRPDAPEELYRDQATGKLQPNARVTLSGPGAKAFIQLLDGALSK